MFTDMVGYTALGQRNESLSLALADEQRKLIRPILARHSGREVKIIGDAFFVEFSSALDAIRCAYDVQRATREYNFSLPEERRIHLRVGIHLGDVVESAGDISGDAVNVASRIEALAEDGGVCFTRQVYDHIQNKFELSLTNLGYKPLKNVTNPVEVYKMVMPWAEKKVINEQRADARRIAVLPFTNISPDPNDEYLADGMTEEMITKLSESSDLKVIARTSIMNYKGKEKSVSQIGKELAVGSIVEGSVRKAGSKIRVTVQLIDAGTQEHLWASNYDRQLDDIFVIQDEVATKVAASLKAGVFSKTSRKDTDDIGAYTFYLKAMQLLPESTQSRIRESISLLEQAIAADPMFVRAHAGLSQAWASLAMGGYEDFLPAVNKAEEEARKALELGPEWAEAHATMARVHSLLDRLNLSMEEAERAIEINPNLAEAHISLGIEYTTFNRLDEAISAFQKAAELDPLSFYAGNHLALAYRVAGRIGESLEVLRKMREHTPNHPRIYAGLAESYMMKREFGTAQEMIDTAMKLGPDEPLVNLDQGLIYAFTGRSKEAEETIEYMMTQKSEGARLYGQLFINTALGRLDEAFKALTRQAEIHSWPFNIESHPLFKDLRKDPRYSEFRAKVGLPNG